MAIDKSRLTLALVAGAVIQACLLAVGLYAGLGIFDLCRGSLLCYWTLNGLYFVVGFAIVLLCIPWSGMKARLLTFAMILLVGLAIGVASTP